MHPQARTQVTEHADYLAKVEEKTREAARHDQTSTDERTSLNRMANAINEARKEAARALNPIIFDDEDYC